MQLDSPEFRPFDKSKNITDIQISDQLPPKKNACREPLVCTTPTITIGGNTTNDTKVSTIIDSSGGNTNAAAISKLANANRTSNRQLLQELGREPTLEEVARRSETTVEEARRLLAMSRYPISLDRPVGNSEDSHFGDLLPDGEAESPSIGASQEMLKGRIQDVLKTLSYREREIIKLRYGLGDGYSYTLEEVGHIFKVTRERIRQIEAKAVRKLQQPSRSQELVGFLD